MSTKRGALLTACLALAATPAAAANRLTALRVEADGPGRVVRIETTAQPTFTVFRLSDPMRVVIDVSGGELGDVGGPRTIEDGVLGNIAVQQFQADGFAISRVIVGFETECEYDVQSEAHAVILRARPASEAPVSPTPPAVGPADRAAAERYEDVRQAADKARHAAEAARQSAAEAVAQATAERQRAQADQASAQNARDEANEARRLAAADRAAAQRLAERAQTAQRDAVQRREQADAAQRQGAQQAEALRAAAKAAEERATAARREAERLAATTQHSAQRLREAEAALQKERQDARRALAAARAAPTLTGVRPAGADQFILELQGGNPSFNSERLTDPARLVVDLPGASRGTPAVTFPFASALVHKVRLGDHEHGVRAVFDLRGGDVTTQVRPIEGGVLVALHKGNKADPTAAPEGTVSEVRFGRGDGGTARIVVQARGEMQPEVDQSSSKAWVLRLRNAHVAAGQERSLDIGAYGTVVRLVSTYQSGEDAVNVVASLNGPARGELRRVADGYVWEITGTETPVLASAAAPRTAAFAAAASTLARSVPTQTRTGGAQKRISLDVKDADIINVLRLISEETGENIVASDEVKGRVTLKLRNVPADQALDTMLRTKGFDKVRHNNILRIASAEAIQKERDLELAKRRSQNEVEETLIKMVTVNYATAGEIVDQIKPMLTGRGSVQVDSRTNTIIMQDIASNVDRLVELTRRLDKQTPLVMIQARIVEAATSHVRDLGVQWGGTSQFSAHQGNPTGLLFPGEIYTHGGADTATNQVGGVSTPASYAVNLPATLSGSGSGLGFVLGSAGGSQMLNLRLSAMENNGSGKIISSPEVATLDNKTARVSQGVEIPISVVSAAGTNTRFVSAKLELEVTPHVTNDGTVLLKIHTQKSEPDFTRTGAAGDPTIQKKEAETEVLVRDGDTSVIGGIYTRNTTSNRYQTPFLSSIPLLGNLFRRTYSQDDRAELLVFITPRIINREESVVQSNTIDTAPTAQ